MSAAAGRGSVSAHKRRQSSSSSSGDGVRSGVSYCESGAAKRMRAVEPAAGIPTSAAPVGVAIRFSATPDATAGSRAAVVARLPAGGAHAFRVDDARDHAETPFNAFRDLAPFLLELARLRGILPQALRIYDPYYCAGSVVGHLNRLGFSFVINRNEDFYAAAARGALPQFDVIVTNPPFSGDHLQRACTWAATCGKPWAILAPDFCARKPFFAAVAAAASAAATAEVSGAACLPLARACTGAAGGPVALPPASQHAAAAAPASATLSLPAPPLLYVGPREEVYRFTAPPSRGGALSGHSFAPPAFQCIWYLCLGVPRHVAHGPTCMLTDSPAALPQLALDPLRRRREEEATRRAFRKKQSRQRKKAAAAAARTDPAR